MQSPSIRSLHPRNSLRRLRTALAPPFSPAPSARPTSSSLPMSPVSTNSSSGGDGTGPSSGLCALGFSDELFSSSSAFIPPFLSFAATAPARARRTIRRKKSYAELEQEDERVSVAGELVSMIEPRPRAGPSLGGIEEILEGTV